MKIQLNNIDKAFAGDYLLTELNLEIVLGSKVAIVGENGSGKSTLLKIIAGIETYQGGSLFIPTGTRVGYLKQEFEAFDGSARAYILSHFKQFTTLSKQLSTLEKRLETSENIEVDLEQYMKVQEQYERIDGYNFENTLETYAKGIGVYDQLDQDFNTLSGGQKTRIALVQMLLADYDVLCLDEPTNHLDMEGIEWLESFCANIPKTILLVSHDRTFLKRIASVYHEIDNGAITSYHGDYDSYREQRHQRYLQLVSDYKEQQKEIQRIKLAIRRYRQWGNDSDNEDFYKRAKTLEKRLERMETLPKPSEINNTLNFKLDVKHRSGEHIIVAQDLVVGYDKPLTHPLNFVVRNQQRFAIVAENGAGKTTLIKTIMGEINPLSGSVKVGPSVSISYLSQITDFKNRQERILEYVQEACMMSEFDARRMLANFGFYQGDVYKPLSYLSGGEGVRLRLLVMMVQKPNCILLDEPTNHLDIHSCEIIEKALKEYMGTIVLVSHDRMFLDNINATRFHLNRADM